jgi:hypothetical protein
VWAASLATFLRKRGVKGADTLAKKALAAANSQSVVLPAEEVAAAIVAELAREVLSLKERIETLDEELARRFFARPEARILASLPRMGPVLGAEFLVCVGDLSAFESADRLAAYAGLVPAAHDDSGKRTALTTVGCVGAIRSSSGSSTTLPSPACGAPRSPGPSTTARGERVRGTPKPSSPSLAEGSTSCGRCCATGPPSRLGPQLDIFIEIHFGE